MFKKRTKKQEGAELYQVQPMEYKLFGPNGAVLGWFNSAGRISKFCWQNIEILPAESGYTASRIICHRLYHIYIGVGVGQKNQKSEIELACKLFPFSYVP